MNDIYLLACLMVVVTAFSDTEWDMYKKTYGKSYKTTTEDQFRLKIFLNNKANIDGHNELHERGMSTYTRGINRFTDMTALEVSEMMNGYRSIAPEAKKYGKPYVFDSGVASPDSWDWLGSGCVTDVKDQGQCVACWAFSVGQNCFAKGYLTSLSEQQLVDCGGNFDLHGCEGGNNEKGFAYVITNGGIDTEDAYPYEAVDNVCRYNPNAIGGTASSYSYVSPGGCEDCLKDSVSNIGPISVGIDVGHDSFQQYSEGVYYEPACSTTSLDHAVLVVGYGNENGQDYWLVKNIWGYGWGEQGYIKMSRNRGNNCGIATDISWPNV